MDLKKFKKKYNEFWVNTEKNLNHAIKNEGWLVKAWLTIVLASFFCGMFVSEVRHNNECVGEIQGFLDTLPLSTWDLVQGSPEALEMIKGWNATYYFNISQT